MSPDRQALLSLYHDDATALLDRALQAQHEPEGLHVVHAALVEALADAHTDGREPGVSTTVPDETIQAAQRALDNCGEESRMVHRDHLANALAEVRRLTDSNARLTDLVRHQRGDLHTEGLISDAEYAALAGLTGSPARLEGYDALRGELERTKRALNVAIGERDAANRDADTYRQILAGKLRRTDLAAAQNGDLMPGPVALASLVLADMIEAKPEAKNRLGWSWTDERTGKGYRVMVEHENGESFAAALATARLDGARVMRDDIADRLADSDIAPFALVAEIRAIDPAAVVGSGSSIHAALPSPDTYQWSATGPNGCLLLSPADCIVARIDRDGTGWRPQIPGRGPLKWAADFPSAVRQVREVLGDVVPDGSAVVGSGS